MNLTCIFSSPIPGIVVSMLSVYKFCGIIPLSIAKITLVIPTRPEACKV